MRSSYPPESAVEETGHHERSSSAHHGIERGSSRVRDDRPCALRRCWQLAYRKRRREGARTSGSLNALRTRRLDFDDLRGNLVDRNGHCCPQYGTAPGCTIVAVTLPEPLFTSTRTKRGKTSAYVPYPPRLVTIDPVAPTAAVSGELVQFIESCATGFVELFGSSKLNCTV